MLSIFRKPTLGYPILLAPLFFSWSLAQGSPAPEWSFEDATRFILEAPPRLALPIHVSRADWDKTFKTPELTPQKLPEIHTLVIHNTETAGRDDEAVRGVLTAHKNRKWSDIGYHFLIAQDSTDKTWKVYQGRPIEYFGAHAGAAYNENTIGIAMVGAYAWKTPSKIKEVRGFFTPARLQTESGQKRYQELISVYAEPSAPESERQISREAADVLVRLVDQLVRDPRLTGLKRIRSHGALALKELQPSLTDTEARGYGINPFHTDCAGHGMIHIVKALQARYQPMLADRKLLALPNVPMTSTSVTASAVVAASSAIPSTGNAEPTTPPVRVSHVDPQTVQPSRPLPTAQRAWIADQASQSACTAASWSQRGKAPVGYVPGMALTYARSLCRLKGQAPLQGAALVMGRAKGKDPLVDAFSWYENEFASKKLEIATAGPAALKSTYTLLIGLGIRESTGRHCKGYHVDAPGKTADTASAGLFQTSHNSLYFTSKKNGFSEHHLQNLYDEYRAHPERCFLEVFQQGVSCTKEGPFGAGAGAEFQQFTKDCPAFAAESAAIMLRVARRHYGPIGRREAELNAACTDLLDLIEKQIEADPETACAELK
jgi:hypothetical protein